MARCYSLDLVLRTFGRRYSGMNLYARGMFGRLRRMSEDSTKPALPVDVAPWQGGNLRAEWSPLPAGRKGNLKPGVLLTAGGVSAQMHASELVDLVNHRIGIAESTNSGPLVFLCWPKSASPTSIAWESTKNLPAESLALLAEPMDSGASAVLTGPELADFSAWITALPR